MPTSRHLLWLCLLLASLACTLDACDGEGDDDDAADDDDTSDDDDDTSTDDDDDTSTDDDDDTSTDDDDDTAAGNCPLEGLWSLTEMWCETYDITTDWFALMDYTTLEVSSIAEGCSAVLTNSSPDCTEAQQSTYDDVTGSTISGQNLGIISCDPAACIFVQDDEPCQIGDRAGPTGEGTYNITGNVLTVTILEQDGLCGPLEMTQIYQLQ
jgi:hypothetical protein